MKVIISHDVDHIGGWCHWYKDLFWEKFLVKNGLHVGRVDFHVWLKRWGYVFKRALDNVDTVMALDCAHDIKSTFFVGVANGLGMSYSYRAASKMVEHIRANGFDCGVHGIASSNFNSIQEECARFAHIPGLCIGSDPMCKFGVRNHYLRGRGDRRMHQWQADAGYLFDSTDFEIAPVYQVGSLWEFPVCLMDAAFISDFRNEPENLQAVTIKALEEGRMKNLDYFTIIFHDVYYNRDVFPDHYNWYNWLVDYVSSHYETCSFRDAISEMK